MKRNLRMAVSVMSAVVVATLAFGASDALATRKKREMKVSGVVNLNQATPSQLDQLPGVGEKAAKKIIAYREKTPFRRTEELVKVKGFGKKKFEKLKPHLSVSGPTTLAVQKAPSAEGAAARGRSAPPTR